MTFLSNFVTEFKRVHRFNGPSFWDPSMLFCFAHIYNRDLENCQNPIRDPSWATVTEAEIEEACADVPSLAVFFKKNSGYHPLYRQQAVDLKSIYGNTFPALIIVDPQNDFTSKEGTLYVSGAEEAFPVINRLLDYGNWCETYVTADWHPMDHCSFAVNNPGSEVGKPFTLPSGETQIAWPVHCLQPATPDEMENGGAAFNKEIILEKPEGVVPDPLPMPGRVRGTSFCYVPARSYTTIYKGMDSTKEAYSGFAGMCVAGKTLNERLVAAEIKSVVICGFATDYCVAATAKDAVLHGFRTTVVLNACRGVAPDTTAMAIAEMRAVGVVIVEDY